MSMAHHEYMELVWESGQVLQRGLSTSRSCSSTHPSHPIKIVNEVDQNNNSYGYTTKRPRLVAGDCVGFPLLGDRERDKSLQDDHHPELFHGLCETNFNMFFENNENNIYDKHMITEAHVVPGFTNANWRPGNASEFVDQVPQLTAASNGQVHQSFLEKRDASVPILFHGLPNSKLQQLDSGPDNHLGLHNFSPILRPSLPKPNQGSDATRPTSGPSPRSPRLQQLKTNTDEPTAGGRNLEDESGQMVPTSASKVSKYFHDQQDLLASQIVPILPIASPPEESPPDEQSEAVVRADAITGKRCCDRVLSSTSNPAERRIKGKTGRGISIDTSTCSREASNDPTSYLEGGSYEEDTEGTAYTSDDDVDPEEEQVPARGSAGSKRRREEVHNLCERRRRDKINKKMRALQDLIPNSNKVDKASMLDEAISYIKSLQLQLQLQVQIMSMRSGLCMPQMMFPTGMQAALMINALQLAQFSPMGTVGMDNMRLMQMGVGCTPTVPFPATSAMFGLPAGQMLPMSVSSQAPFIPLNIIAGHSTHSSLVPMPPAMSGMASTPLDLLPSAAFSCSNYIIQTPKH